jgi:polyhydroxyalkanoate synthase
MVHEQTAAEPQRMARILAGLRKYQEAGRAPSPAPMPAIAARHGALLRDYGGQGPSLLFVPSLINPPSILDLSADKSLLRWLSGIGFRPFLIDWGQDVTKRRAFSVAGHVEHILLPFIDELRDPPILIGYCLGGTMAVAAAGLRAARGVATIATPWCFSGFSDDARARLLRLWGVAEPAAKAMGILPMEVLQSAFWSLDPARTVSKFDAFAGMAPATAEARAFVRLEDWANDGPPLPEAAARELFERFVGADGPGKGEWMVGSKPADPGTLDCPLLNIVSTTDRIVPATSAFRGGERVELDLGHVGMVIGGRAEAELWQPLATWLSRVARQ